MHLKSPFTSSHRFSELFITASVLTILLLAPPVQAAGSEWKVLLAEGEGRLKTQELQAAEDCFRRAVQKVRQDKNSSADDVARCLKSLAGILQFENNTEDALPLYKNSLHTLERAHGKQSREIVPTLLSLGAVFEAEGEYRRAIKFYDRAVLISENLDGTDSLSNAECQYRLGRASFKAGSSALAETCYGQALTAIMHQSHLPSDLLLASLLSDYIDLLSKTAPERSTRPSNFQQQLLKDQITSVQRTKGTPAWTWDTAVSGKLKTELRGEQGIKEKLSSPTSEDQSKTTAPLTVSDFASLEALSQQRVDFYERMIAADIDSLGANHPSVARDLYGLASVYLAENKYEEAKPLLMRALDIYRRIYKTDTGPVRRLQSLLNLIAEEQNAVPDLGDSGRDYLAILPRIPLAAQNFEMALRLNYLALLCFSKDRLEAADKIYAWALAATALACGERSMLTANCLTDYGRLLRRLGRQ
ncbi:MAG: hypothetical protein C5B53_13440, partial [Candidatus Melainabacteria bacterium]